MRRGFDLFMWTKYRINYVFIFDFDSRNHVLFQNILEAASIFTILWITSLLLYLSSTAQPMGFEWLAKIPFQAHPLSLLFVYALVLLVYEARSRWWLVRTLVRIVIAPFKVLSFL